MSALYSVTLNCLCCIKSQCLYFIALYLFAMCSIDSLNYANFSVYCTEFHYIIFEKKKRPNRTKRNNTYLVVYLWRFNYTDIKYPIKNLNFILGWGVYLKTHNQSKCYLLKGEQHPSPLDNAWINYLL